MSAPPNHFFYEQRLYHGKAILETVLKMS